MGPHQADEIIQSSLQMDSHSNFTQKFPCIWRQDVDTQHLSSFGLSKQPLPYQFDLPENPWKLHEGMLIDIKRREMKLLEKRLFESIEVCVKVLEPGWGEFYVVETDGWIQFNRSFFSRLSHHLLSSATLLRNENRNITHDLSSASKPITFNPFCFSNEL